MPTHEELLTEIAEGINREFGLVTRLYYRFILGCPQVNEALVIAVCNEGELPNRAKKHLRKIVRIVSGFAVSATLLAVGRLTDNLPIGAGGAVVGGMITLASMGLDKKRAFVEADIQQKIKVRLATADKKTRITYETSKEIKRKKKNVERTEDMIRNFAQQGGFARCDELRTLVHRLETLWNDKVNGDEEAFHIINQLELDEIIDFTSKGIISPGPKYRPIHPRDNRNKTIDIIEEINDTITDYGVSFKNLSAVAA